MRTGTQAIDWMIHQINHPSQDWRCKCQSSVRQALGLPAWAASAKIAHDRTPKSELHHTTPDKVPPGAICYGLLNHTYGHAWLAGHNGNGFSVDYKRRGQIDRVPLALPHWTHDQKVIWTLWTPYGHIKP
jgi:hypothetical protein